MAQLTYRDFQQRLSIQDILQDAGYRQNLKDGRTYPSYSREKGDKFIVTRNGLACFRPPEQRCYNVISFIKSFPELFSEYRPGMDKDRLVNLVCNRLLNQPMENVRESAASGRSEKEREPFDIDQYETVWMVEGDRSSEMQFFPYFRNRGINLATARAFSDHFFLASKPNANGRTYTNLSFPLSAPGSPGKNVLGLEERSKPNSEGKCAYKGLAKNSDCTNGLWIASPSVCHNSDIFWFESAYDAMAFYQLHVNDSDPDGIDYRNAAYLSTSGSPSISQFRSVLALETDARHRLCFDNDRAGHQFAINFALCRAGHIFQSNVDKDGNLVIKDFSANKAYKIDLDNPDFSQITEDIGISNPENIRLLPDATYKDWNEQLMASRREQENHKRFHR